MKNKNIALTISGILLVGNLAVAMEGEKEKSLEPSNSLTIQSILHDDKEKISMNPLYLSNIPIEKSAEFPAEKKRTSSGKVSKTLPLNRSRKNSGSPRAGVSTSPKSVSSNQTMAFLVDQGKDCEEKKRSSCLLPDEQKESPRQEKSPRLGFKRYSLVGPVEDIQIPVPNSSQMEQQGSLGREGAISPMCQRGDSFL